MDGNQDAATIMVVDDMEDIRKMLTRMLNQWGYRTEAFPEGMSAIQYALENPPDLFLLDINMPGLNGYEICKLIKDNERLKSIPVIFISVLHEELDRVKAFGTGAVDYITKPFHMEEVFARVSTHIKMRQYRQKLKEQTHSVSHEHSLSARKPYAEMEDSLGIIKSIRKIIEEFKEQFNAIAYLLDDKQVSILLSKLASLENEINALNQKIIRNNL